MLERPIGFHKWQRGLNLGVGLVFTSLCFIPLCAFVCYVKSVQLENSLVSMRLTVPFEERKFRSQNKEMEETLITQLGDNVWIPIPKIGEKLLYLTYKNRPDVGSCEQRVLLGLAGTSLERLACPGEIIYLQCSSEDEIYFSEEKTPFWCKPTFVEDGKLQVSYGAVFENSENEVFFEYAGQRCLAESMTQSFEIPNNSWFGKFINNIEASKGYSPDLLIDLYGGESFNSVKGLFRVKLKGSKKGFFFLKEGDFLTWEGGDFMHNPENTQNKPLILVKAIDSRGVHCIAWDSEGVMTRSVTIPIIKSQPLVIKPLELFSKIHFRSDSSVTCHIQNRDVILREGDWLLHTKSGWRSIHTSRELKDYLRYALKGELFIFDKIKKTDMGVFFTGRVFDEVRDVYQQVEIPLKVKSPKKLPSEKKRLNPNKKEKIKVAEGV